MHINTEMLQDLTTPQNYRWAFNHYLDEGFLKQLIINPISTGYVIKAQVKDYWSVLDLNIVLDEDYNLLNATCDCHYQTRNRLCGHVVGVLLAINKITPTSFPFKDTGQFAKIVQEERQAALLLREQLLLKQRLDVSNNALSDLLGDVASLMLEDFSDKQAYQLYTNCISDPDYNGIYLDFKIGAQKKYVIKSILSLLESIRCSGTVSYGKGLAFRHSLDAFDAFTQQTISVVRELYYLDNATNKTKQIFVSGNAADIFFDHFYECETSYINMELGVTETHLKFIVEEQKKGVYQMFLLNMEEIIFSDRHIYQVNDEQILRMMSTQTHLIARFITEYFNGSFNMMDHRALDKLLSLFDSLAPFIEYELKFDYTTTNSEVTTKIYVDIEDENLHIKAEAHYEDASVVNAFVAGENTLSVTTSTLVAYLSQLGKVENEYLVCPVDNASTDRFIHEDIDKIRNYCEVYVSESIRRLSALKSMSVTIGVKTNNNLLEVDLSSFDFDVKELKNVMQAYQKNKKYYRMKNGEVIKLDNDALNQLDETMQHFNIKANQIVNGKVKLPLYRSFEFDQIVETDALRLERKDSFSKLINNFSQVSKHTVNKHYDKVLRPYQREGVEWMMSLTNYGFGGILADDMGLGKTLQVISLLESVKHQNHSIVVCPAVLLYNWQDEVAKFSKSLNCVVVSGNKKQREQILASITTSSVIITTYDYVRSDYQIYEHMNFDFMVIDEAQYIKNHATKSAKAIKLFNATNKIALTGTPIENTLAELWSIFDFLMPGYLFEYAYFSKHFERKIVRDQDPKAQERLKKMVEPFILRRMKKDVLLDLPDKIEQVISFKFSPQEQNHYLAKLSSVNEDLKTQLKLDSVNKVMILSMLTQLRQICCDSRLLLDTITHPSTKVNGCMDLVENLISNNRNVLVFSAFTSVLDLLAQELQKRYIPYFVISGSVSKEQRRELVDRFQKGEVPVFLISLKAGGVGLNLTNASAVIHFDPWWNVSAQNQATDRAYRIGQEDDVQVYKLIMKDSIEEKILKMQEKKKELSDMFVENSDGSIASMDVDSIMDLLKHDL